MRGIPFVQTNAFRLLIIVGLVATVLYFTSSTEPTPSIIVSQQQDLDAVRSSNTEALAEEEKKEEAEALEKEYCLGPVSLEPESDVDSIFNCGSKSGLCHYYYPAKFFSDCGAGQDFLHLVNETETKRLDGTLWNNMPSIGFPTLTMPDKNISMIHVHKVGGTSLHSAFDMNQRKNHYRQVRHHWFFPKNGPDGMGAKVRKGGNRQAPNRESMYKKALEDVKHAVRYPATFGETDHVMFALIRDPSERFISSIGQAMGASGSQGNGIAKEFREECIKNTTQETLRCCIDYVTNHTTWVELHFTPQSLEISFATIWQDVPVAIFDFKDIGTVLEDLGYDSNTKRRDGHNKAYRKSEVLAKLSTDDYDEDMLNDLCNIYKVDVLMRRAIGLPKSRCDHYVT